jgi:hypothetical protein
MGKPEGKIPLGRHRRRWEDNIRTNFREKGWDGFDWIHRAQDKGQWQPLLNTVMNFWVRYDFWKFLNS